MATWNPPADSLLAAGKPGKPSHARAVRDLPAALAERAAGSPWLNEIGVREFFPKYKRSNFSPTLETTWVVPDGVRRALATILGGGGSGGDASGGLGFVGGGGGSGAVRILRLITIPGEVWSIKVGAGGSGELHPSVDITLDDFEIGDGARTELGPYAVAGGKRGENLGIAGEGGGTTSDGHFPTILGSRGGEGYIEGSLELSGVGAVSIFGGGGGARSSQNHGYPDPVFPMSATIDGVERAVFFHGAGGSGAFSLASTRAGGVGGVGAVVIIY